MHVCWIQEQTRARLYRAGTNCVGLAKWKAPCSSELFNLITGPCLPALGDWRWRKFINFTDSALFKNQSAWPHPSVLCDHKDQKRLLVLGWQRLFINLLSAGINVILFPLGVLCSLALITHLSFWSKNWKGLCHPFKDSVALNKCQWLLGGKAGFQAVLLLCSSFFELCLRKEWIWMKQWSGGRTTDRLEMMWEPERKDHASRETQCIRRRGRRVLPSDCWSLGAGNKLARSTDETSMSLSPVPALREPGKPFSFLFFSFSVK